MLLVVKRCAWAIHRRTVARESRYRASARALLEQLKPDERTALILLGLGCTYKEICELRGWSHTKLHRCLIEGRARVRKLLARGGQLTTSSTLPRMDERGQIDFTAR